MEYTQAEWNKELRRRFGDQPENFRFVCPRCGRVNRGYEFVGHGAHVDDVAQMCIGKVDPKPGIGCDYVAYSLFETLGKGDVIVMMNGNRKPVFPMDRTD